MTPRNSSKANLGTHPVVTDLPEEIAAGIGNVVSRWAQLEWHLRTAVYSAIKIDVKRGRIAVRDPRLEDSITMIEDLLTLDSLSVPTNTDKLRKQLVNLKRERDLIAHSVWLEDRDTGKLAVQNTGGAWNLGPRMPRVTRRMHPGLQHVDKSSLQNLTEKIQGVIGALVALNAEINFAQQSSPKR